MSDTETTAAPKGPTYATDHLANERTFLAWVRTSLAVIGLGFAVAKFGTWLRELAGHTVAVDINRSGYSVTVGVVMIATGGAFAVIAAVRHKAVAYQIENGRVRSANATVAAITVIILILALATGLLALHGTSK